MQVAKESSLIEAVRHPLRIRILEVLNELDMTPTQFVEGGHADFHFGQRPPVNKVAYHFRTLAQYGCLQVVGSLPSRGSIATIYRGSARVEFIDREWSDLTAPEKRDVVTTISQGLIARIDGALTAETINSRDDRQVSWFAMSLDERGWSEAAEVLADAYWSVKRIQGESETRLTESEEPGISATAAILMFESPDPALPADA